MSTGFGRLAALDEYAPEGESWDPPPEQPPALPNLSRVPQAAPAPLAFGSPRVAQAPTDEQRMGAALDTLARQPAPKSWRERVYDTITGGAQQATQFIPPEVRGKVGALNAAAEAINPVASSARGMRDVGEGKYGSAAAEFAGLIPMEGIAAAGAKLAAAGKVAGAGAKAIGMGMLADPTTYVPAMFIGPKAKGIDKASLTQAKGMEKAGSSADEILDTTGWARGAVDKKWKREISDRDTTLNSQALASAPSHPTLGGAPTTQQVLPHPELYKAYPQLGDAPVYQVPRTTLGGVGEPRGAYDATNNRVYLNPNLPPEEARKVLLHELQHGVQKQEGFSRGGSPTDAAVRKRAEVTHEQNIAELEARYKQLQEQRWNWIDNHPDKGKLHQTTLSKQWRANNPVLAAEEDIVFGKMQSPAGFAEERFNQYRNLAGETEARNVAARADLTGDQRFLLRPEVTEDVLRSQQWGPRERAAKQGDIMEARGGKMGEVVAPSTYVPSDHASRRYAPTGAPDGFDVNAPTNKRIQTVRDPYRMGFPGIYANPREIAREAGARVIAEDPALKRLWGVSRGDLDAMAVGRVGNEQPVVPFAGPRSRGALSAENVMTPRNEQRLGDILHEGGRIPGLKHADAWYIMDPMYHRLVEMFGPEEAVKRYRHLNAMTGMASPGSDVLTEVQRGTGAHWLQQQGRWDDFKKFAGVAEGARGRGGFPDDMRYIGGHPYHKTAQVGAMDRYLRTGKTFHEGPKVPLYIQASGVPQTGFQTISPVGDAHYSRGVGLADTRKGPTDVQGSFSVSESQTLQPWWQNIAAQQGIEAVPAQARLWTVLGPQTGVDSPLGQGKLELFSQQIMVAAKRLGISPENARDLILSGGAGAGMLMMAAPGLDRAMGGLAAQDQYQ